jgi:hypothetical protein
MKRRHETKVEDKSEETKVKEKSKETKVEEKSEETKAKEKSEETSRESGDDDAEVRWCTSVHVCSCLCVCLQCISLYYFTSLLITPLPAVNGKH